MTNLKKLVSVLLLSLPAAMNAQGFQVNLQGQVQQGMGGAGTAYIQDASSLFFNPGGSSFLKENSVNVGVTPVKENGQFLDNNTGETSRTSSPVAFPFAAYGVFSIKDSSKLKLGLAIYTPFGSTVEWQSGWIGRFALTRLQLEAIFFQPTVSYKLTDKIGIGAGFVYSTGKVNLQKDLPTVDANGNYGHVELNGKASGYGFNAGIYFKPTKNLSLGLTYRSQVNMKVTDGDVKFTVPSSLASDFPNGKFTTSVPLPQIITLGVAYSVNQKLTFALDINYAGWKAYDTLKFDYANNTSSLADTKSARNYKNSPAFRLGAQYKITDAFSVRLGGAYGITPIKAGFVTPETPDANRFNLTAGIGYTYKNKLGVNASFFFTQLNRTDTNIETGLSGTFKTYVVAPGISLFYKF